MAGVLRPPGAAASRRAGLAARIGTVAGTVGSPVRFPARLAVALPVALFVAPLVAPSAGPAPRGTARVANAADAPASPVPAPPVPRAPVAPLPPGAPRPSKLEVPDSHSPRPRRRLHDVDHVTLEAGGGVLAVRVRYRQPLVEGVYACVHVYVDCDADEATGLAGADLWVRASFGSRYQRTDAPPPVEGAPPAASLLRASWSRPFTQAARDTPMRRSWIHDDGGAVDPPVVTGAELAVDVPLSLLAERGLRYNRFVRVRLEAEGTCSEHPVTLSYVCADEGTRLALDGRVDEWSGQPTVADATGELHPDVAEIDLASLSVDHDADHVHALVRLAGPGFGLPFDDGDVVDHDELTVALEPLETGGRYMDYVERTVGTRRRSEHGLAGDRCVEFSIPRAPQQTAFRVAVWADAIRIDKVPEWGTVEVGVPPEAFKPR